VTTLQAVRSRTQSSMPGKGNILLSSKSPDRPWRPRSFVFTWEGVGWVNWPTWEANRSHTFLAGVRNVWSYTSMSSWCAQGRLSPDVCWYQFRVADLSNCNSLGWSPFRISVCPHIYMIVSSHFYSFIDRASCSSWR